MELKELHMLTLLLFSLTLLSLSSSSSSSTLTYSGTFSNAAKTLLDSDSDYLSMALTLELVSNTLNLDSPTATIFAPSDPAFVHSGQLPFLLVQYHILPIRLSAEAMKTLPSGTSIPTLLPNCSLTVTASHSGGKVSINKVMIDVKAVYDDGSVIIYGIDEFLNSSFQIAPDFTAPDLPIPSPTIQTERNSSSEVESFGLVSDILRSRGYSIMAAFLDAQLAGPKDQTSLTIFAPVDVAIQEHARNVSDYMLIFRQHVVPRLLSWLDLIKLKDGTVLPTFLEGFEINVTVSGDVPEFNGVPVIFLNMYQSRGLVVHGLNHLLTLSANQVSLGDSSPAGNVDQNPLDHGDYH